MTRLKFVECGDCRSILQNGQRRLVLEPSFLDLVAIKLTERIIFFKLMFLWAMEFETSIYNLPVTGGRKPRDLETICRYKLKVKGDVPRT